LSLLEQEEKGKTVIPKRELFAGMVSHAWYTIHYFHVSFGKFDLLGEHVHALKKSENLDITASHEKIFQQLTTSTNSSTRQLLMHFDRNVPHWFLSPWFPKKTKKEIYECSKDSSYRAPYELRTDSLIINHSWLGYFIDNWKLALYLQAKNPNVPDIPNKLIKPAQRNPLNKQRSYWDTVMNELGGLNCIYTNSMLLKESYVLDHFIPYSFVSHDLIWNLIPAEATFNIKKSDKLPRLEVYFDPFYRTQKQAVSVMLDKHPRHPLLEDYLTIFPRLDDFKSEKYYEQLQSLIIIAANNEFEYLAPREF
jgi:5-methylcytosine-specific restriction endonuclease McrA